MKIYEEREVTGKHSFLKERTCDLCGKKADKDKGYLSTSSWGAEIFEINETEIKMMVRQTKGSNYPEGGSGTEYEIDLCPDCFKNRLVPWLKSQGANIEEKEWEW